MITKQTILLVLVIFFYACKDKVDNIKVIQGLGICFNSDSILLSRTSPEKLIDILSMKDTFRITTHQKILQNIYTGLDTTTDVIRKTIVYKGLEFDFEGDTNDSLYLENIKIKTDLEQSVFIHDSIYFGQINPPIDRIYKMTELRNFMSDDSLLYSIYSKGISFELERIQKERKLIEVAIYSKFQ